MSGMSPLSYSLGTKKPILPTFGTKIPCWGTTIYPYELVSCPHIEDDHNNILYCLNNFNTLFEFKRK